MTISHLIAISGFHLGVLTALLYLFLKYPYKILQTNYFPYRSYTQDTFIIIASTLFVYMLFIDSPASLLRAFTMLIIGFILYSRGIKIISMQTLFLSCVLLIVLFPRLIFNIGFFLSLGGVFYIFLFMQYYGKGGKVWHFVLLPLWIYIMMLPYTLTLFGNFSLYHPLSIIWTALFSLFYPLAIFLHFTGEGNLLDSSLEYLLHLEPSAVIIKLSPWFSLIEALISIAAIFKKEALYLLILYTVSIFIYSIYYVT
ncbi:ComEC/Rec2 family competence protein [Sulfurimonas sp.]